MSTYADKLDGVGRFGSAVADTLGKVGTGITAVQAGNLMGAKNAFTGLHGKTLVTNQVPNGVDVILTAHAYCIVKKEAREKVGLAWLATT